MKRITIFVSGKIQEVKYRERVVSIALNFMLTGSVQNLNDGRVKVIAEGAEDDLKLFVDAINIRNTLIVVENMEIEYSNATYDYDNFYKLVGEGETDSRLDTASEYLKKLIEVILEFKEESNKNQSIMIEKQNENTVILKEFKKESNKKQDIMIEKQNENISTIQNESEKTRKRIDKFNSDSIDHMELNYRDIKEEITNIKVALKKAKIMK